MRERIDLKVKCKSCGTGSNQLNWKGEVHCDWCKKLIKIYTWEELREGIKQRKFTMSVLKGGKYVQPKPQLDMFDLK